MSGRTLRADRRLKGYAIAALGLEFLAVTFALIANLTRHFDGSLNDLSQLAAGAGLVMVGMAAGRLEAMNRG